MKKRNYFIILCGILLLMTSTFVFAEMHGKKESEMGMGKKSGMGMMGSGMMNEGMMGMMDGMKKGMMCKNNKKCSSCFKVKMILENSEALNLTDEQIDKIIKLKMDAKKNEIKKQAEVDVLKIDKKELLMKDEVDLKAVKKILDDIYKMKADIKFICIETFENAKKILTDEQKKKLKSLKQQMMKGMMGKGMMNMMQGGMMKDMMGQGMKKGEMKGGMMEKKKQMSQEEHESHH